jgi:hypothetical protein
VTTSQDIEEAISEAEGLLDKASETSTAHEADHLRSRAQVMLLAELLREVRELRAELAARG